MRRNLKSGSSIKLAGLDRRSDRTVEEMAAIWNQACGAGLSISAQLVAYNLRPSSGGHQAGWLAVEADQIVGFALASRIDAHPSVMPPNIGWIDALAVDPDYQRQGIGHALLSKLEAWLIDQGCDYAQLGGSLRPFAPGLPVELHNDQFFRKAGYQMRAGDSGIWDVAANLAEYQPPMELVEAPCAVRPAQPGQELDLMAYMEREFAGRWHYGCREFLAEGGRISDFMLLWTETGIDGFCQLTFEDSARPLERFYPYQLPRPWGQLGAIGVSEHLRGQGFGSALLDAGLRRLHSNGVNGCVIDWTTRVDFYAKFGFSKYRHYWSLMKAL
jgi:GNAT superfamily N-acetyltransferase